MLDSFKRYFSWRSTQRDLDALSQWAQRHGYGFKRARGDAGFVVDGQVDGRTWRMEWGPPQRAYIEGYELRLRMELGVSSDLQMLVLTRALLESLERQAFENYTDQVQTKIDASTPEEMRWLVMFPKVNLGALGSLKLRFGAVASAPTLGLAWIEGHLAAALALAAKAWLPESAPLVLMTLRGKLYLRTVMPEPNARIAAEALKLFLIAAVQALRAAGAAADGGSDTHSGGTTAWQTIHPEGLHEPPPR